MRSGGVEVREGRNALRTLSLGGTWVLSQWRWDCGGRGGRGVQGGGCGVVQKRCGSEQGALCGLDGLEVGPGARSQSWGFTCLGKFLNPLRG